MKLFVSLVMLFIFSGLFAQPSEKDLKKHRELVAKSKSKGSVVTSLDTIFNSGEPYCIYVIVNKDGPQIYESYMKALNGGGEVYIEYYTENSGIKYAYRYYFIRSGEVAEVPLSVFKKADDFVTEMDLFAPDGFNETGKSDILKKYPAKINPPKKYTIAKNEMMIRNFDKPISIYGRDVMQDNRLIAKIEREFVLDKGDIIKRMTILNDRGNKVAAGEANGMEDFTYTLTTSRDNKSRYINSKPGSESMDIVSWLVKNGYL